MRKIFHWAFSFVAMALGGTCLAGCTVDFNQILPSRPTVAIPDHFSFAQDVLSWGKVENASKYMADLTPEQRPFARKRNEFPNADSLTNLLAVVKAVHPSILVGTSTRGGAFSEEIVREMASATARPIIFPLSNPTELAEAKAADLIAWTEGRALVATGIPSAPVTFKGKPIRSVKPIMLWFIRGSGLGGAVMSFLPRRALRSSVPGEIFSPPLHRAGSSLCFRLDPLF